MAYVMLGVMTPVDATNAPIAWGLGVTLAAALSRYAITPSYNFDEAFVRLVFRLLPNVRLVVDVAVAVYCS